MQRLSDSATPKSGLEIAETKSSIMTTYPVVGNCFLRSESYIGLARYEMDVYLGWFRQIIVGHPNDSPFLVSHIRWLCAGLREGASNRQNEEGYAYP